MHLHTNRPHKNDSLPRPPPQHLHPDLRIWDPETRVCEAVLWDHMDTVRSVVSGSYDGTARVWEVESGGGGDGVNLRHVLTGHEGQVLRTVADDTRVVTGSLDTTIRVWDPRNG